MRENIEALSRADVETPEQREAICVAIDALEAVYDGPEQMKAFADHQNASGMTLCDAFHILPDIQHINAGEDFQEAFSVASDAIEASDLQKELESTQPQAPKKILECSSRGDRRFSALFANVTIKGKERSIEEFYQDAKRTADGKKAGKGKPFDHIIDPYTGDKLPASEAIWLYRGLWIAYLTNHPELVEYASQFDDFNDSFRTEKMTACQADVIGAYVKGDREQYVDVVKCSLWYKNMAVKKRKPLDEKIQQATERQATGREGKAEQLSLFPKTFYSRG